MSFDPVTCALREIRLGEIEIIQSIAVVVRDRNWRTVAPEIKDLGRVLGVIPFEWQADCQEDDLDFSWHGIVDSSMPGCIRFRMEGSAKKSFMRNRIGLCVHIPAGAAGLSYSAEHVDGSASAGALPIAVSPHQPLRSIKCFWGEVTPGTSYDLRFEGDIFEMEDQRNWIDASFKIYSTPLDRPFPVEMHEGDRIDQIVTLTLRTDPVVELSSIERDVTSPIRLEFADRPPVKLPKVGLGASRRAIPLIDEEVVLLRALALSHLRVDVTPSQPEWRARLANGAHEAEQIGAGLEIALHLGDEIEAELTAVVSAAKSLPVPIVRWLVFDQHSRVTSDQMATHARAILGASFPAAQIGGGTDAYFAELNRNRPALGELDCVSFSINPQVHSDDTASIFQNLEGIGPTILTAHQFRGGAALAVSPVTHRPRFNVYATEPSACEYADPDELDDPRHTTEIGASWTLGCLKALVESAIDSVTFYETAGQRGVIPSGTAGHSLPPYPLYRVFADLADFAKGEALPIVTSAPRRMDVLALRHGRRSALLCTNMTSEPQTMALGADLGEWAVAGARRVDQDSDGQAKLTLLPFEYVRLDRKE
jgi:hypothetical protein